MNGPAGLPQENVRPRAAGRRKLNYFAEIFVIFCGRCSPGTGDKNQIIL